MSNDNHDDHGRFSSGPGGGAAAPRLPTVNGATPMQAHDQKIGGRLVRTGNYSDAKIYDYGKANHLSEGRIKNLIAGAHAERARDAAAKTASLKAAKPNTHAAFGLTNAKLIGNAAAMHGIGSTQHKEAIRRFGGK